MHKGKVHEQTNDEQTERQAGRQTNRLTYWKAAERKTERMAIT
jgi:hypothetical protein